MSDLIKEINSSLNKNKLTIEDLTCLEDKLTQEYDNITEGYRCLFRRLKNEINKKTQESILICNHDYIRYAGYHNERYFVCDKCGHEKQ